MHNHIDFSSLYFQMCSQIACSRRCIVTLVAFVGLFFTVCFQMCSQSACIQGCKVSLVACIGFFSTVCFQMCPQSACIRGYIVTLVALVWLFPTVPVNGLRERMHSHTGCICLIWWYCWSFSQRYPSNWSFHFQKSFLFPKWKFWYS